jgi:hypothetical protein
MLSASAKKATSQCLNLFSLCSFPARTRSADSATRSRYRFMSQGLGAATSAESIPNLRSAWPEEDGRHLPEQVDYESESNA